LHKLNKLVETEGTTAKIETILEHWDRWALFEVTRLKNGF
jgi:hypothetical protein